MFHAMRNFHKTLTDEQLRTIFSKVTGILNNRPIGWDEEGIAITPQQVLQLVSRSGARFPSDVVTAYPQWQKATATSLSFWKRWRDSVLKESSQLAMSRKGHPISLKEGQVVLVSVTGGDAFHQSWVLGRIVTLHMTKGDGQV
jgi:hypothetical protein